MKKQPKKTVPLDSTELNKYRRTMRDLNELKIIDNTSTMALRVLEKNIARSTRENVELDIQISNVNNKVVRTQNKEFISRFASLIREQDEIDTSIADTKIKISDLQSQIDRVDLELEKYSTRDDRPSLGQKIEVLENRLLHKNQQVSLLKLESLRMKDVVGDILFRRRRFQIERDAITAKLMVKKQEIMELVDHYSIAFANDMKNCRDLELCRIKSAQQLKDQLQEMRHLIRTAETNDILQEFMVTKATPIELTSDSVPKREILMRNYQKLTKICEDQLSQVKDYAPDVTPDDLVHKRKETFSLYLFENEIKENIEDKEKELVTVKDGISVAKKQIQGRKDKEEQVDELLVNLDKGEIDIAEHNERVANNEALLSKYLDEIHKIYNELGCDTEFGFESGQKVTEFNLDEVLQLIEIRLRHVMYSIYCWQEEKGANIDEQYVHGLEIVKPRRMPKIEFVSACPECSQVEAKANPDVEKLIDDEKKLEQLKDSIMKRNMMARMHHIEDCPKPGSKAVLSKDI